jgi:sulfatase modifying factor 1
MVPIPGGMGSDKHYPEEAPVHRVKVDPFWIDRTPVTNRQFREFVRAAGYVIFTEIPPDPKNYPGALPPMFYAGNSSQRRNILVAGTTLAVASAGGVCRAARQRP